MANRRNPRTSRTPRFGIVITMMLVALVISLVFAYKPATEVASADVSQIAKNLGDWSLQAEPELDKKTMAQMLADSYISRTYQNRKGDIVQLLVIYRRYGRREFSHRPELCFPAAGYSITKNHDATLPYGGRDIPVKYLTATWVDAAIAHNPDVAITYFFASGKKTEQDFMRQQMWMALERVIPNKNGWTFVRMTSVVRHTPGEDPLAVQQDFMRTFGDDIERVITTDTQANSRVSARATPLRATHAG